MEKITQRGILLAQYDTACWHASDILMDSKPDQSRYNLFLAKKIPDSWEVVFGMLNPQNDAFLIAYNVILEKDGKKGVLNVHSPALSDTDFYLKAALGVAKASQDFIKDDPPGKRYNFAVIPNQNDFWVYFYPAQTEVDVFPLGGDVRYLLSGKTGAIIEKRRLHQDILEVPRPPEGQTLPEFGMHVAVLANIPEDTDVFHVLTRQPSIPQIVRTDKFVFEIKTDGTIVYTGKRDVRLKKNQK
ncbi:MAG: hypothetical protein GY757_47105 [bacterium]|nr:hypothetical protein [bacterium]